MKKFTLIFVGFFCITALVYAQNANVKTYFDDHFIGGLAEDGEYIWVGVDSLLIIMNKTSGVTFNHTLPISSEYNSSDRYASSISLDSNGLAWITCFGPIPYLVTFDGIKTWTEIPIPTAWFSGLVIDKNDKVWASTIEGLHQYDGTNWIDYNASNTSLPYSSFTSLAVDNHNNKWLGLTLGLGEAPVFLVKFDDVEFTMYQSGYLNGIGGMIWSIDTTAPRTVWMGTYRNGLIKYDGIGWEVYNTSNSEIPPEGVQNVKVEGTNIIWLSTQNGLTRFDRENWETFNTENSMLPSNSINSILIDENGTKWVGTDKGLISFGGNILGTSDKQTFGVDFKLFPNPVKDFITLIMPPEVIDSTLEIFNIQGKLMKSSRVTADNYKIDTSNLASGMYFIRLQMTNGIVIKKFVKQN